MVALGSRLRGKDGRGTGNYGWGTGNYGWGTGNDGRGRGNVRRGAGTNKAVHPPATADRHPYPLPSRERVLFSGSAEVFLRGNGGSAIGYRRIYGTQC